MGNDGQFAKLCGVLGATEWARDERYATNAQRVRNLATLAPLLRERFAQWQRAELIAALDAAGVPCGPINSVADVFEDRDERTLVNRAVQKKLRGRARPSTPAELARLYQHLMRQGFTPAVVSAAIRRLRRGSGAGLETDEDDGGSVQ